MTLQPCTNQWKPLRNLRH